MKRAFILAAVAASGALLGIVPGAQADLRVGKNYRLNADSSAFRGKDQVALAVDPANPQHVVEVNADYLTEGCEHTVSFDGGATWSPAVRFANLPGFRPTCRVPGHLADQLYQTVAFGRGQNVYVAMIAPKEAAGGGEEGASVVVSKSTDGGKTFSTPTVAMRGGVSGAQAAGPSYELPTVTVDPGSTSAVGPGSGPVAPRTLADCKPGRKVLTLGPGNDTRQGTPGDDLIFAEGGDDVIDALAGDDCIDLGPGNDRGQGGTGADLVVGGSGNDNGRGSSGNDRLTGNGGNDSLLGNSGNDVLLGGRGSDRMSGGGGNDRLSGQSGKDRITGSGGRDRISGGSSSDRVSAGSGGDRVAGGSGNDSLKGGSGNDRVSGNSGKDRINGGSGRDRLSGGSGNDSINARDGQRDRVSCGSGRDKVAADRIDRVARNCEAVSRVASRRAGKAASAAAAAPRATAAASEPERVYIAATETTESLSGASDAAVAVPSDGGKTFSQPTAADPAGENAVETSQPVVGRDGSVYVAYRNLGVPGQAVERPLKVVRSVDHAKTWQVPVTAALVTAGGVASNSHVIPSISTASTFPRLAIDKRNDSLYLVYGQGPPGPTAGPFGFQGADHFIHLDMDVWFQRSLSHGTKWSVPKRINDATPRPGSEVTQTRHPNVYVAPNGRVDIVWQDRRHWYQPPDPERRCIHTHLRCDEARLGDTYYAYSNDGGGSFSKDRRITDRSHNNDVGYDYRFGVGWAFGPVAVPMGDNQLLVGWMDSREGNYQNDNLDIYLAKVNHAASGAVPQETVQQESDIRSLSARLSKLTYPGGGESLLNSTFATRNGTRVVIANEGDLPGTLAAGVLARANLSQVLLSRANGLSADVKAEVARMQPAGAYIVGGVDELSPTVEADLLAAGVPVGQITRIDDANPAPPTDPAELAANIALLLDRRRAVEKDPANPAFAPAFDAVVIANPGSADSAAVAGLAAARRLPILYTDASGDALPTATTDALAALNINKTLIVGGQDDVSNAVAALLPNPTRLGGADQYATSAAVVGESKVRGLPDNIAFVAHGTTPMDGALLGSTVGRINGLLLLAPSPLSSTGASTAASMGLNRLDRLILVE